jgi:hypothetical protein
MIKERHVYDDMEDKLYIERVQDVQPILEANKRAFDVDDRRFKNEAFNHVARIPMIVIEKVKRESGIDLLKDEKALKKFLNDPDNKLFRTKPGRI